MRDGPEVIFTFVLGLYFRLKEKIVAQAQKKRRQKAPENSWYIYIFPCQTSCINFMLLQRRELFSGGYGKTWGLSHFALVTHHVTD